MSTKIYDNMMSITSFYCEFKKSRCIEFNIGNESVLYTEDDVKEISEVINKWLDKET